MKSPEPATVDEYIDAFPPATQALLREVRSTVRLVAPEATERISYSIPTFDWHGPLVYFAGFKHHVSVYPVPGGHPALEEELAPYKGGKGTARFPLDQPLPLNLIRRIVELRMRSNLEARDKKKQRGDKERGA